MGANLTNDYTGIKFFNNKVNILLIKMGKVNSPRTPFLIQWPNRTRDHSLFTGNGSWFLFFFHHSYLPSSTSSSFALNDDEGKNHTYLFHGTRISSVKVHHSIDFNYRNQTTAACPSPTLRDGPVERQSSNEVLLAISLELEIVEKFAATHRPPAERRRREICVKTPSTHTAQKFAIRNLI